MRRDASCLIFKEWEKVLGTIVKSKHVSKEIQRVILAFFEDSDFCAKETDSRSKIQKIVDYCSSMHEATGGKVQN